jgi:tRNA nucleotidyltransferase/poly(A) polymerase
VGEAFGVMLVPWDRGRRRVWVEVATFREDLGYSDGRRPDGVRFTDAEHDARRRDFTINGLFEDPLTDSIIDHVGGRADLESKVIRAIGDPHARFREDHLRMLRAVRFAARFGFAIDAETADAIRAGASNLDGVSRERVGGEVRRMLTDANRAVAAWELQYLGLDQAVLHEPTRKVAPTRLGRLPEAIPYPTTLAAWILDRHGDTSEQSLSVAKRWAVSLMLSNEEAAALSAVLTIFGTLTGTWEHLGVAKQKRLASDPHFEQGLHLVQATDRQLFVDVRRRVLELAKSGLNPTPLITGEDLIAIGLKPGPSFSAILASVFDAQLEGSVSTKAEALEMVRVVLASTGGQAPPRASP